MTYESASKLTLLNFSSTGASSLSKFCKEEKKVKFWSDEWIIKVNKINILITVNEMHKNHLKK